MGGPNASTGGGLGEGSTARARALLRRAISPRSKSPPGAGVSTIGGAGVSTIGGAGVSTIGGAGVSTIGGAGVSTIGGAGVSIAGGAGVSTIGGAGISTIGGAGVSIAGGAGVSIAGGAGVSIAGGAGVSTTGATGGSGGDASAPLDAFDVRARGGLGDSACRGAGGPNPASSPKRGSVYCEGRLSTRESYTPVPLRESAWSAPTAFQAIPDPGQPSSSRPRSSIPTPAIFDLRAGSGSRRARSQFPRVRGGFRRARSQSPPCARRLPTCAQSISPCARRFPARAQSVFPCVRHGFRRVRSGSLPRDSPHFGWIYKGAPPPRITPPRGLVETPRQRGKGR